MRTNALRTLTASALLLAVVAAWSDSGDGAKEFCDKAISEYNSLVSLCRPERANYWQGRYDDTVKRYNEKSAELNQTSEMLGRQPNGKELQEVYAYDYLNEINQLQLDQTTALVEDLGRELVNDKINREIMPAVRRLDPQFAALQGKPHAEYLESAYTAFLDFKRRINDLEAAVPLKETYLFEPKANAYATEPIKRQTFEIHDWPAAFAQVDVLRGRLQAIQDSVQTALFFTPKDPIPWLPVATQPTVLLVSMAGWVKSYHDDTAFWAIGLLVLCSMGISVFLVFYSKETWWNIARQSVIPGLFIVYWMAKYKGWVGKSKPVRPGGCVLN